MSPNDAPDPNEYVQENQETLVEIIKHSNNTFVRSLCIAAIVEYGDEPDIQKVKSELENLTRMGGGE